MKKERSNSKVAVLADARAKKEAKESAKRNAIKLDKRDRRELQGLIAWGREVAAHAAPFEQAQAEWLAEVQERYGVTLNVTHGLDVQNQELVPMPEKPAEETPPQETA